MAAWHCLEKQHIQLEALADWSYNGLKYHNNQFKLRLRKKNKEGKKRALPSKTGESCDGLNLGKSKRFFQTPVKKTPVLPA